MFFKRLFDFPRRKAWRQESELLRALVESTEMLLSICGGEHSQTTIPESLCERCRQEIASARQVMGLAEDGRLETLREAREKLGRLANELGRAAFENAAGPTIQATCIQDALHQLRDGLTNRRS